MASILSREEMDALLLGISRGDVSTRAPRAHTPGEKAVRAYDLVGSKGSSGPRMAMVEAFARRLKSTLSKSVRRAARVDHFIASQRFEDFLAAKESRASIHPFEIDPPGASALLALDLDMASTFIELFMGGGLRKVTRIEDREFTGLERRIITRVARAALGDLQLGISETSNVKIRPMSLEKAAHIRALMPPEEQVITATLTVEMGAGGGRMHLCLPLDALKELGAEFPGGARPNEESSDLNVEEIMEHLGESAITLRALLGGSITLRDLLTLKAGDLLALERDGKAPAEVLIEGVPKLWAHPGRINGNWAVRVARPIPRKLRKSYS